MSIWAIGSENKAKIACVKDVVERCFPTTSIVGPIHSMHKTISLTVESLVSDQPMSVEESIAGAKHRAAMALKMCPEAHFGVGIEAGIEQIGDKWFECGWMCVIERATGRSGLGSSGRLEMSSKIMRRVQEKKELAEVVDELTGEKDVRSGLGIMGVLTGGHLRRKEAYSNGLMFALAPFLSEKEKYWDE